MVAGTHYVLQVKANDSAPEVGGEFVEVWFDGNKVGEIDPTAPGSAFSTFQFLVQAGAGDGTAKLEFRGVNGQNIGVGLDDIRLVSIADSESAGGNDLITGGNQADTMMGGDGNDTMHGNEGNNTMYGGSGNNFMTAGNGHDTMLGGGGNDIIHANEGNNRVNGGAGDDTITAGNGNDNFAGGGGNDVIYANEGNNNIALGVGNDEIWTGNGRDLFLIDGVTGNDTIFNFRLTFNQDQIVNAVQSDQLIAGPLGADWDDQTNLGVLVPNIASNVLRAFRSADGGDLRLEIDNDPNVAGADTQITLKWFFWNNANVAWSGSTFGAELTEDQTMQVYLATISNYNPGNFDFV